MLTERQARLLAAVDFLGPKVGITKLVKSLFLVGCRLQVKDYEFIRWHYGPYSTELSDDIEELVSRGFLEIAHESVGAYVQKSIEVSESGRSVAAELPEDWRNLLAGLKGVPLRRMIEAIYEVFKVPSIQQGRVLSLDSEAAERALKSLERKS